VFQEVHGIRVKSEWGRWPVLGEDSRECHTWPSVFVVGEKINLGVPSAVSRTP